MICDECKEEFEKVVMARVGRGKKAKVIIVCLQCAKKLTNPKKK